MARGRLTWLEKTGITVGALIAWVFLFFQVYTAYKLPRSLVAISDGKIGQLDPRFLISKAEHDPRAFDTPELRALLALARKTQTDVQAEGILYGILSFPCPLLLWKCLRYVRRRAAGNEDSSRVPSDHYSRQPTEKLVAIFRQRPEWYDTDVLEAIRQILIERGVDDPSLDLQTPVVPRRSEGSTVAGHET